MNDKFEDLRQWSFDVDEVSAGVYRASGADKDGRSVQFTGTNPDELLERCRQAARELMRQSNT